MHTPHTPTPADLRRRVSDLFPSLRHDLEELVRIPSVSSTSGDPTEVQRSAAAVAELLRGAGMDDVEVVTAHGADGRSSAPAVLAHRPGPPGSPTVMLYAHHDVQPTGPAASWSSRPFEPTERDGRLYGRGAADDKAGVIAHVGALRVLGPDLPVGVTVFVEGEEEVGSPGFGLFLDQYRERLAADVIVVADSVNWSVGVPALTTSLRGLAECVVEVRVLDHAVHSGMFGGPVLDAVTLLCRLVATLHDEDGEVAVEGLARAAEPQVDLHEDRFRAESSLLPGVRLAGTGTVTGRLWSKPAIAVVGLDATPVAEASNTLAASARAKLSLRIAPGQDPAEAAAALRRHLEARAPLGSRVTVHDGELGKAFQAPADSPAMAVARSAFADAWGTAPVDTGIGGSIPFIADLLEAYPQAAILVTGVEDPDSRAHGADESVHLGELEKVVVAEALLVSRLGSVAGPQG